jgi:hypothetical protein
LYCRCARSLVVPSFCAPQSLFGFGGSAASIEIALTNTAGRAIQQVVRDGPPRPAFVYSLGEDVAGDVKIAVQPGKQLQHAGVKAELVGVAGPFARTATPTSGEQSFPQRSRPTWRLRTCSALAAETRGEKGGPAVTEFSNTVREISGPGVLAGLQVRPRLNCAPAHEFEHTVPTSRLVPALLGGKPHRASLLVMVFVT